MSFAKIDRKLMARTVRTRKLRTLERVEKVDVLRRDGYKCRFPKCGCKGRGLALHVAHLTHKGMGGNPKGDRSTARGMILVCVARHRENQFAIDRGTLRARPLTDHGCNGPVAWDIDVELLASRFGVYHAPAIFEDPGWTELAREARVQFLEPFAYEWQADVVASLATMER